MKGKQKEMLLCKGADVQQLRPTCSLAVMSLGQFADTLVRFAVVSFMSQLTEAGTFLHRAGGWRCRCQPTYFTNTEHPPPHDPPHPLLLSRRLSVCFLLFLGGSLLPPLDFDWTPVFLLLE